MTIATKVCITANSLQFMRMKGIVHWRLDQSSSCLRRKEFHLCRKGNTLSHRVNGLEKTVQTGRRILNYFVNCVYSPNLTQSFVIPFMQTKSLSKHGNQERLKRETILGYIFLRTTFGKISGLLWTSNHQ